MVMSLSLTKRISKIAARTIIIFFHFININNFLNTK